MTLEATIRAAIVTALFQSRGKRTKAAAELDVSRSWLWRKITEFQIQRSEYIGFADHSSVK